MPSHLFLKRAKLRLERRLFLKALGAGMALPAALHFTSSATAQSSGAPKRFFLMYLPHGIATEHFTPRMTGPGNDPTQFALDQTNVSILGGLEQYKQYVNVYQGFQYPGTYGTHEGVVNVLSGVNSGDTTTPRTTMEQVIGKSIGTKPLILGACSHQTYGLNLNGMLFWDGTPIDPEKNPAAAADKLFANLGGDAPSADQQLRAALLDLTTAELQDLKTSVSSLTREQSKLQTHLDSIEALKAGGGSGVSSCTTRPNLPTVERVRQESAGIVISPSRDNDYFYQEANFRTLLQAQLELVTQALICNAAQVIALMPMYPTAEFNFDFVRGDDEADRAHDNWSHHSGLSHTQHQAVEGTQWNSPITIDNVQTKHRTPFARAQRWFIDQLVNNVIATLATTPDPSASDGSTVLDNSLVFVMSEIGEGDYHTRTSQIESPQIPTYLPFVTIGKAGGALKSGQVVSFDIAEQNPEMVARPAVDLYLTLAHAMGATDATFPGSPKLVEGVLA